MTWYGIKELKTKIKYGAYLTTEERKFACKVIDKQEKIKEILKKRDNAFDGQEFGASYSDLDGIIEEIRAAING